MSTNAIAVALEGQMTAIARSSAPTEVDAIGLSPFAMVGDHTGTIAAGNWERITYTFPVSMYVERLPDAARTSVVVNDLLDSLIAAFRVGIKLGATVSQAILTGWNTNAYSEPEGQGRYKIIQLTVEVTVAQGRTYTA